MTISEQAVNVKHSSSQSYEEVLMGEYLSAKSDPSKKSRVDSKTLDLILSLPTPRKENELVRYLLALGRRC